MHPLLQCMCLSLNPLNALLCFSFPKSKTPSLSLSKKKDFMVEGWFSRVQEVVLWCKEVVSSWWVFEAMDQEVVLWCKEVVSSWWVFEAIGGFGRCVLFKFIKRLLFALLTFIFVLGGAIVGIITGALKGQTTETGFCRGAGIGVVAGAITAIQLLESLVDGESLSKVALLSSLMNGKVFMEWVSPAVLKAYQWQIGTIETTYRDISDIYDNNRETSDIYDISENKGLPENVIQKLPQHKFNSIQNDRICCTICLQKMKDGESARRLPICSHFFHVNCIDKWLTRQGSCPICREDICKGTK